MVTYFNNSKIVVLGVSEELMCAHGAVSGEVAAAMVEGACWVGAADIAVSVIGIVGLGGGSEEKSVGTVWFGLVIKDGETVIKKCRLHGDRERIRLLAAYVAFWMVWRAAIGGDVVG